MKKLIVTASVVILGIASSSALFAQGGDEFEPVFVDSLKKCASNKGQTAKKVYRISAGPDRVFIEDTIKFVQDSKSGVSQGVWWWEEQYEMEDVTMEVKGKTYNIPMPSTIVIEPWAETGSHTTTVCAWNNGYIHAETIEIDP